MNQQGGQYTDVLDTAAKAEADRLREVEEMADPTTIRWLDALPIKPGWRCLEIGAGAGSIARWLCQRVGTTGFVVAVDLKTELLERLDEPNLEVRRCDLRTESFEENAYDFVHGRFVLMHLGDRRDEVVRMLRRALRPGGMILVEDADYELFRVSLEQTSPKAAQDLMKGLTWVRGLGMDNFHGRRLPALIEEAGFVNVHAEAVASWMRGPDGFGWFTATLDAGEEHLIQAAVHEREEVQALRDILRSGTYGGFGLLQIGAWGRAP